MDTQSAVRIGFRLVFRIEFVFGEGFWIVLPGICHDGRRVQTNEGRIQHTHFIELFDLTLHDLFCQLMVQLSEKAVISPVGGQGHGNVEAAVVSDKAVIVEIIHQIGNVTEALALHDDEGAEHGGCGIAGTADPFLLLLQLGQIQMKEQGVIKSSLGLRGKQADVLYHFLSVDSNQPPFGWFGCNLIIPKMLIAFYIFLVTRQF